MLAKRTLRLFMNFRRLAFGLAILAAWMWTPVDLAPAQDQPPAPQRKPSPDDLKFFEQQVRPLLVEHCWKCHSGAEPKGGLRLDYQGGILLGGDSGPAVSVDTPQDSLLLQAVNYDGLEMPPRGKLPSASIAVLEQWVAKGAPAPAEAPTKAPAAHAPPRVTEETRSFWSFRPPALVEVPQLDDPWAETPIDAFVLRKLNRAGLRPAGPANKTALLRRAFYDLTGLPPTQDEVAAFMLDESPDAFEHLVDRLLASPHYGEKWGRHWLDLVRYAETNSYERDGAKPFVWRYRDYVIRSFNEDKPYDEFILEQLAGDEFENPTEEQLVATGYYRLGIWDDEPVDAKQAYFDDLDDILSTTGQVFLGLTVGCARCHDHKLDPIPQADYYRMLAFFTNIRRYGVRGHDTVLNASVRMAGPLDLVQRREEEIAAWRQDQRDNQNQLNEREKQWRERLKGGERDDFRDEASRIPILKKHVGDWITPEQLEEYVQLVETRDSLRKSEPEGFTQVLCVKENGPQPQVTHILGRGSAAAPGEEVQPGFLSVLGFDPPQAITPSPDGLSSGRRTVLARWIADAKNPLTARVMVNRIWQFHFGRGLVPTASDFGLQGDEPTHPELLDWLARDFVDGGWRMKRLHKLIMLSNAYQMSSQLDPRAEEKDPLNHLLWRFNMRRLQAEEIRDSILAVTGNLNRESMFGPSVYSQIPAEVLAGQSQPGAGWGNSPPDQRFRRSIYIHVKRSLLTPVLAAFDYPEPDFTCPMHFVSTQPTQSLGMLNGDFINQQAADFRANAERTAPRRHPGSGAGSPAKGSPTRANGSRCA